jgi:hypothetical protein
MSLELSRGMSALCQKQTLASLFDANALNRTVTSLELPHGCAVALWGFD